MADGTPLKLKGIAITHPTLPAALRPTTRAAAGKNANEFLPDGYLKIDAAFDLSARARATASSSMAAAEASARWPSSSRPRAGPRSTRPPGRPRPSSCAAPSARPAGVSRGKY